LFFNFTLIGSPQANLFTSALLFSSVALGCLNKEWNYTFCFFFVFCGILFPFFCFFFFFFFIFWFPVCVFVGFLIFFFVFLQRLYLFDFLFHLRLILPASVDLDSRLPVLPNILLILSIRTTGLCFFLLFAWFLVLSCCIFVLSRTWPLRRPSSPLQIFQFSLSSQYSLAILVFPVLVFVVLVKLFAIRSRGFFTASFVSGFPFTIFGLDIFLLGDGRYAVVFLILIKWYVPLKISNTLPEYFFFFWNNWT